MLTTTLYCFAAAVASPGLVSFLFCSEQLLQLHSTKSSRKKLRRRTVSSVIRLLNGFSIFSITFLSGRPPGVRLEIIRHIHNFASGCAFQFLTLMYRDPGSRLEIPCNGSLGFCGRSQTDFSLVWIPVTLSHGEEGCRNGSVSECPYACAAAWDRQAPPGVCKLLQSTID